MLGYEGAWFSWSTAQMRISSWRKCGWLGCLIAPEEIDRTSFIDRPSPAALALTPHAPRRELTLEGALAVPEGVRAGSLAAAQAQVQQLQEYISATVHAPFDPVEAGLLAPKTATVKKRTRDKSRIEESEGGDATLRDLAGMARTKQSAKETRVAEVAERKEERVGKKARLGEAAQARLDAFEKCRGWCVCPRPIRPEGCPAAGLSLCPTCGDLKPTVCRRKACLEAVRPLLLTMAPQEPIRGLLTNEEGV